MGKHLEQTNQTRQNIIDAFWSMAESDGVRNISVSAVVKKAGINRSTFYEYFSSVEDLADHVEGSIIDELKQLIGDLYIRYNFSCSYRDLARALAPYYDRLALLLGEGGDKRFLSKVQREAVALASEITAVPDPMIEYELAYVVSAFAGVLTYWNETGKKISEDAFTELFHTMSIRGLEAQCVNAEGNKKNRRENMSDFTHFDELGNARMVDVSDKPVTKRTAKAKGTMTVSRELMDAIMSKSVKKGDVLTVAQVAGIMSTRKTADLIPMCHPLGLSYATVTFEVDEEACTITAICDATTEGKTGVEMEALTGVSVALLTIYDMCKSVDRRMVMSDIHLVEKTGGKSGDFVF